MIRFLCFLFTFIVFNSSLLSQSNCYLHLNAGQSNAGKIYDELLDSWEATFKTDNTCDYFEVANIATGGTMLHRHLQTGDLWNYNTSQIQAKLDFLATVDCDTLIITMSWYQGEQDAFKVATTYASYKAGLAQIQADYSTFLGLSEIPMLIMEINADSADWNLVSEDAVDQAGEDYASENSFVDYHDISSYDGSTYIHQELNNSTGQYENMYADGIHCAQWYVDQYITDTIQNWVANEIGWTAGTYSCPCVADTIVSNEQFCAGESFVWQGQILTTPGFYEEITSNYHGCDITNQLTLTEYPVGDTICDCITESFVHFEDGNMGGWEGPGGSFSKKINNATFANSGSKSWRLRGDKGVNSSIYSNAVDFSAAFGLSFHYHPHSVGFDSHFHIEGRDSNGDFQIIKTFSIGEEIVNDVPEFVDIAIYEPGYDQLRIRTEAASNADFIYLDDIKIDDCPPPFEEEEEEECMPISFVDLDDGSLGIWESPGGTFSKMFNHPAFASSPSKSWRLRGHEGVNSSIYSNTVDFSFAFELSFHYYPKNVEAGDYLYIEGRNSSNGEFDIIDTLGVGDEIVNNEPEFITFYINEPGYDQLRIRSQTTVNNELFFLDDLKIDTCDIGGGGARLDMSGNLELEAEVLQFSVYPNPVSSVLSIESNQSYEDQLTVELFDLNGRLIQRSSISQHDNQLDISALHNQLLIVRVSGNGIESRIFKVLKQ